MRCADVNQIARSPQIANRAFRGLESEFTPPSGSPGLRKLKAVLPHRQIPPRDASVIKWSWSEPMKLATKHCEVRPGRTRGSGIIGASHERPLMRMLWILAAKVREKFGRFGLQMKGRAV